MRSRTSENRAQAICAPFSRRIASSRSMAANTGSISASRASWLATRQALVVNSLVGEKVVPPQDIGAEPTPLARLLNCDNDGPTVAARVRPIGRDGRMLQTEPAGLALGVFEMEKRNGHPIRHAVEHCDFDRLTAICSARTAPRARRRGRSSRLRCPQPKRRLLKAYQATRSLHRRRSRPAPTCRRRACRRKACFGHVQRCGRR